jgi:hypothetical protein
MLFLTLFFIRGHPLYRRYPCSILISYLLTVFLFLPKSPVLGAIWGGGRRPDLPPEMGVGLFLIFIGENPL